MSWESLYLKGLGAPVTLKGIRGGDQNPRDHTLKRLFRHVLSEFGEDPDDPDWKRLYEVRQAGWDRKYSMIVDAHFASVKSLLATMTNAVGPGAEWTKMSTVSLLFVYNVLLVLASMIHPWRETSALGAFSAAQAELRRRLEGDAKRLGDPRDCADGQRRAHPVFVPAGMADALSAQMPWAKTVYAKVLANELSTDYHSRDRRSSSRVTRGDGTITLTESKTTEWLGVLDVCHSDKDTSVGALDRLNETAGFFTSITRHDRLGVSTFLTTFCDSIQRIYDGTPARDLLFNRASDLYSNAGPDGWTELQALRHNIVALRICAGVDS